MKINEELDSILLTEKVNVQFIENYCKLYEICVKINEINIKFRNNGKNENVGRNETKYTRRFL